MRDLTIRTSKLNSDGVIEAVAPEEWELTWLPEKFQEMNAFRNMHSLTTCTFKLPDDEVIFLIERRGIPHNFEVGIISPKPFWTLNFTYKGVSAIVADAYFWDLVAVHGRQEQTD